MQLVRTNSANESFRQLVGELNADLEQRDGDEHGFYMQFNGIEQLQHVVVAFIDDQAVGCGALREYGDGVMEIKRMYVREAFRRKGIAAGVLKELEKWAMELAAIRCILETGKKQPEAIAFYATNGYSEISCYGPYKGVENSVCFEKAFVAG